MFILHAHPHIFTLIDFVHPHLLAQVGHPAEEVLASEAEGTPLYSKWEGQVEGVAGQSSRSELLVHYQFPPYCTGEAGKLAGQPSRREVGGGRPLATISDTSVAP